MHIISKSYNATRCLIEDISYRTTNLIESYDHQEYRQTAKIVAIAATTLTGAYFIRSYFFRPNSQEVNISQNNSYSAESTSLVSPSTKANKNAATYIQIPSTPQSENQPKQKTTNIATSNPVSQPSQESSPEPIRPTENNREVHQILKSQYGSTDPNSQGQMNSQTNSPQHYKDAENVAIAAASLIMPTTQPKQPSQNSVEKSMGNPHEIEYVDVTGSSNATLRETSHQTTTHGALKK